MTAPPRDPEATSLVPVTPAGALVTPAVTLRTLLPKFLAWLRFVRERSENSVLAYEYDLESFVAFAEQGGLTDPNAVKAQHIEAYGAWLRQVRGLSASSVNRHRYAIKTFYRYLIREDIAPRNPADLVAALKVPKRLPTYLSIAEQEKLLAVLSNASSPSTRRTFAIIATMMFCGLRISEVSTLRPEDLDLQRGVLRVIGKGDRQRECPIIARLRTILHDYVTNVRPRLTTRRPSPWLFVSTRRWHGKSPFRTSPEWREDRQLPQRGLYAVITAAIEPVLGRPVHPHALRHSFASRLRENGAGIDLIREALGHASITTTMIYAHISTGKQRADIERFLEGDGGTSVLTTDRGAPRPEGEAPLPSRDVVTDTAAREPLAGGEVADVEPATTILEAAPAEERSRPAPTPAAVNAEQRAMRRAARKARRRERR
jgi:site-specific recombinase XerD